MKRFQYTILIALLAVSFVAGALIFHRPDQTNEIMKERAKTQEWRSNYNKILTALDASLAMQDAYELESQVYRDSSQLLMTENQKLKRRLYEIGKKKKKDIPYKDRDIRTLDDDLYEFINSPNGGG